MCEKTADNSPASQADAPAIAPSPVEQQIVVLRQELDSLRRELVDLRMGQRKALLEELAALENPLVEQGVLAQRTRPRRQWSDATERE